MWMLKEIFTNCTMRNEVHSLVRHPGVERISPPQVGFGPGFCRPNWIHMARWSESRTQEGSSATLVWITPDRVSSTVSVLQLSCRRRAPDPPSLRFVLDSINFVRSDGVYRHRERRGHLSHALANALNTALGVVDTNINSPHEESSVESCLYRCGCLTSCQRRFDRKVFAELNVFVR